MSSVTFCVSLKVTLLWHTVGLSAIATEFAITAVAVVFYNFSLVSTQEQRLCSSGLFTWSWEGARRRCRDRS